MILTLPLRAQQLIRRIEAEKAPVLDSELYSQLIWLIEDAMNDSEHGGEFGCAKKYSVNK